MLDKWQKIVNKRQQGSKLEYTTHGEPKKKSHTIKMYTLVNERTSLQMNEEKKQHLERGVNTVYKCGMLTYCVYGLFSVCSCGVRSPGHTARTTL